MSFDSRLKKLINLIPLTAQSIIYKSGSGDETELTVAASRVVARLAAGNLKACTVAEILTLLSVSADTSQVLKALFDANTILAATTDDTPAALTVAASTFVGRKAAGNIAAMSVAEATTLLAIQGQLPFETVLGSIITENLVMPACTVNRIDSVVMGPTTDTAAETLTFSNETGDMANGVITIASGAVAAEKDTAAPTTNNVFALGEALGCVVGGENGQATLCRVTVFFTLT